MKKSRWTVWDVIWAIIFVACIIVFFAIYLFIRFIGLKQKIDHLNWVVKNLINDIENRQEEYNG